jgi:hypothetical protein
MPPARRLVRSIAVLSLVVLSSAAAGGCRKPTARTVASTYDAAIDIAVTEASTVLFIPGVLGSEIVDPATNRVYWGEFLGDAANVALRLGDFEKLALPIVDGVDRHPSTIDDELDAGNQLLTATAHVGATDVVVRAYPEVFEGVVRSILEHDRKRIRLEKSATTAADSPIANFGYDWRRSIAAESERLHFAITVLREKRIAAGLDGRVNVVAHSMGTQVLRYYLRHGAPSFAGPANPEHPTWAGARYVKQAVLIAPPNLGEAGAFLAVADGHRISALLPEIPASLLATFPSAYQLMPRVEDARVVWKDSASPEHPQGDPVDIYDVAFWEKLGWGLFAADQDRYLQVLAPYAKTREARVAAARLHVAACLDHAKEVHAALDRAEVFPDDLSIHVFVGATRTTPSRLGVDRKTGELEWIGEERGDGVVTRFSALGRPARRPRVQRWSSVHFSGGDHTTITGDVRFLADALYILFEHD